MDKAWIFLLIFLGTLAAAGAISVWIIQRKLRQVSRSMFGTDSLLELSLIHILSSLLATAYARRSQNRWKRS